MSPEEAYSTRDFTPEQERHNLKNKYAFKSSGLAPFDSGSSGLSDVILVAGFV